MSKKKQESETNFARENRDNRIKNCKECNGAPIKGNFSLQGVCGEHCITCLEVITWKREGHPTLVKSVVTEIVKQDGTIEDLFYLKQPGVNFDNFDIKL